MIKKILIAPDSFKESMSSKRVCDVIEEAILEVNNGYEIEKVIMADGGEGSVDAICSSLDAKYIVHSVKGPLLENVSAKYALVFDTAIIEMASASGLMLVPSSKRNPYLTTSYGTGELIMDAINRGAKNIILGIGGSATNDGGVGMLMAMGAKFLDKNNESIKLGGLYLKDICTIDLSMLASVNIKVACDVDNILTGDMGASYVFGAQKGANKEMIETLDNNLKHFAKIVRDDLGKEIEFVKGAGAAGGLGAALLLIGAKLYKGIDLIMETNKLEEKIKASDLVITGEGAMDSQTRFGKTPYGVAKLSKKYNKPLISFSGSLSKDSEILVDYGFTSMFSIVNKAMSLEEAISSGEENLRSTVKNVFRLIEAVNKKGL